MLERKQIQAITSKASNDSDNWMLYFAGQIMVRKRESKRKRERES